MLQLAMTNNDIFRRIRFAFDFDDEKMMALFALADQAVTRARISDWLKKDEDPAFQSLSDCELAIFLNGLIHDRRGKKEGAQAVPEQQLNNNIIIRKLKIALDLKEEDMLALLALAGMRLGRHELSAFFRRPDHRHYRECKDQVLRNLLTGMQMKYRASTAEAGGSAWDKLMPEARS
nr:DUF1456 family protein [Mariprofundus erugo]